jgi:hypothetical protein
MLKLTDRFQRTLRRAASQRMDSLGRLWAVCRHTSAKLLEEQKLCVTATVRSRFSTACHHPAGTKITSPGICTPFSGCEVGHDAFCVRGHTVENHATPDRGRPGSVGRTICIVKHITACERHSVRVSGYNTTPARRMTGIYVCRIKMHTSLSVPGGNSAQRLCPCTSAFHA